MASTRRPISERPRSSAGRRVAVSTRRRVSAWALACLSVLAVGCAAPGGVAQSVEGADVGHVHDLVLVGDELYAATHLGLFVVDGADWTPVGQGRHDLMALTVDPDGTFVASGHPDLRDEALRVEDRPPLLGLVTSDDQGQTWTAASLLGEADFHALVVTEAGLVAADGTSGNIMVSRDRIDWETRGSLEALDLAAAPGDPDSLVGVTYDGGLLVSDDGGRRWRSLDAAPMAAIEWTPKRGLVAASSSGTILTSSDGGATWSERGSLDALVEALLVTGDDMWVAIEGGTVLHSGDGGTTWQPLGAT